MNVKMLERIDDVAVLQLPVPGFENLSLENKLLIHNLWNAGISGDSITIDQKYRYGHQIFDFFLDILDYRECISPEIYEKLETYAKKIVINKGIHKTDSTKKFFPEFTLEELREVVSSAQRNGFKHRLSSDLEQAIFDETFELMLTQKSPPKGKDILTASHNNFYHNVQLSDLKGFTENNPLNSTLVKEENRLVEKVWRAGNSSTPPGIYSAQLKRVVKHLTEAITHAHPVQKKSLELLREYFERGDAKLFDEYNIEWVHTNPEVDTILGFIEEYRDARGCKGTFESIVYFKDHGMNHIIRTIADNAQFFEEHSPWLPKYKKKWDKVPVANAIIQVLGAGDAGPFCWAGVNLPNPQWIRQQHGSKNIYISNVTYASRHAFSEEVFAEFLERSTDKELMKDSFNVRGPILVTLHEVVGHGAGKVSETLKGDPRDHLREYYSSLEEARAELCSLHHVWNPRMRELGLIKTENEPKAAYLGYVFQYLTLHRRFENETEIHEDHERATSLIVQYCIDKGSARFYKKNNKTYPEVVSYELMRQHIAELLSEVMRIKAEGDYAAGRNLIETYGVHFDPALRDEIIARAKSINYPSRFAYVMPRTELVHDAAGNVSDVKLVWYDSVLEQARAWREIGRGS